MVFGKHCIKTYSQPQETVAPSSAESEFHGIAKAATRGLGMRGLMEGVGGEVGVQVDADSSFAKSTASRRSALRVRHIEVRELWFRTGWRRASWKWRR